MENIDYKGYTIKIQQDDIAKNPREWDNLGVMVCSHRRYDLGDKDSVSNINFDNFNSWEEVENFLYQECNASIVLPLWLYDHSGLSLKVFPHGYHGGWDCGQVGFIYITKETLKKEYSVKRITKKIKERVKKVLLGEVETYSYFINGNVYYYSIEDSEGLNIDSCGGFYGWDFENNGLMEYAQNTIDCYIREDRKKKQIKLKELIKNKVALQYR